ncbi:MAG: hypothetical protein QM767_23435 [Anaeromyxobacter sp.]
MPPAPPAQPEDASLASAGLDALREAYPQDWARVSEALLAALATGSAEKVAVWMGGVRAEAEHWRGRLRASGGNPSVAAAAQAALVRERLARLAVEKTTFALAARQAEGSVRLDLWSGILIQRLLFARGLERKPASAAWFRRVWPLVRRRSREVLMPLLAARGVYCFYTRALVDGLARLAGGRPCLEVAAGDGTLSRFLRAAGVEVTATDDASWSAVALPPEVERLEARAALRAHPAPVVLCSWPPAGNRFERAVLEAPHVERYVVIGSRHAFATGDCEAYARQQRFDVTVDEALSAQVLPPELEPEVRVFTRR